MPPVNGFVSANFTDIAILIAGTFHSYLWDGYVVSYGYSAGIMAVIYWIMAVFCILTLLWAIFLKKKNQEKINRKSGLYSYLTFEETYEQTKIVLSGFAPETSDICWTSH